MTVLRLGAAAAVALAVAGGPAAAEPLRLSELYIFGDSLSDPGNLFALTQAIELEGGPIPPSPPYFDGRASNGPVWAEHITAGFAARGLSVANFSYVFGQAVSPTTFHPGAPASFLTINLSDQLARFALEVGVAPPRAGALFWLGANDAFRIIERAAEDLALGAELSTVLAGVAQRAQAAATAIGAAAATLLAAGVDSIVVLNLPDLAATPAFADSPGETLAAFATQAFNAALAAEQFPGQTVARLDIEALFTALLDDPAAFGLSGLGPCFVPSDAAAGFCTDPAQLVFFDTVHPSSTVHAAIADAVRTVVAPIPLPATGWLLLAVAAVLGGVARRRRAA